MSGYFPCDFLEKHIPKATVLRCLYKNNRNVTMCSHFKANCWLKVYTAYLELV